MWHLSRPQCLAVLEFPAGYGTPYVAYDQQGLVFAAATSTGKANIIKLYDARNVRPRGRRLGTCFGRWRRVGRRIAWNFSPSGGYVVLFPIPLPRQRRWGRKM